MTQVKSLKYPNATQERVRMSTKSYIVKCIDEIRQFVQSPKKPSKPSKRKKRQLKKFEDSFF